MDISLDFPNQRVPTNKFSTPTQSSTTKKNHMH